MFAFSCETPASNPFSSSSVSPFIFLGSSIQSYRFSPLSNYLPTFRSLSCIIILCYIFRGMMRDIKKKRNREKYLGNLLYERLRIFTREMRGRVGFMLQRRPACGIWYFSRQGRRAINSIVVRATLSECEIWLIWKVTPKTERGLQSEWKREREREREK